VWRRPSVCLLRPGSCQCHGPPSSAWVPGLRLVLGFLRAPCGLLSRLGAFVHWALPVTFGVRRHLGIRPGHWQLLAAGPVREYQGFSSQGPSQGPQPAPTRSRAAPGVIGPCAVWGCS
jgi:hypothetical protein